MKKVVWTALLMVMSVGVAAGPASAQSIAGRRQARLERMEQVRERMRERGQLKRERLNGLRGERFERLRERRQQRLDRNRDGRLSRAERIRARIALRRTLRRAGR